MSIWNAVKDHVKKGGYSYWPRPWNMVKEVNIVQCNDGVWAADITFAAKFIGTFFLTNFVPSPTEIFRNLLFGKYKCGGLFGVKLPRVSAILWGEGTNRILVRVFSPFLLGAFYWWLSETAVNALSGWTSLLYEQKECANQDAEASVFGGIIQTRLDGDQAYAFGTTGWAGHFTPLPLICAIAFDNEPASFKAMFTWQNVTGRSCTVIPHVDGADFEANQWVTDNENEIGVHHVVISGSVIAGAGTIQPRLDITFHEPPVAIFDIAGGMSCLAIGPPGRWKPQSPEVNPPYNNCE